MIQEDVTHSSENDIQIGDPKNLGHFLSPDHIKSISKGGDESSVIGLIEKESNFELYQPLTPFLQWLSWSHLGTLEKEDS